MYNINRRFYPKIMAVVLCFMLAITFTCMQIQEAQAFIPLLGLAPEVIAIGAGLLTAAGITFASNDAARAAGYKFVSNLGSDLQQLLINAKMAAGLLSITPALWSATKTQAANISNSDGTIITYEELGVPQTIVPSPEAYSAMTIPVTISKGDISFNISNWYGLGSTLYLPSYTTIGMGYISETRAYRNNNFVYDLNYHTGLTPDVVTNIIYSSPSSDMPTMVDCYTNGTEFFVMINGTTVLDQVAAFDLLGRNVQFAGVTGSITMSLCGTYTQTSSSYTKDPVYYGNPSVDYSNTKVQVPTTYDGVRTSTPSTVLTGATGLVTPVVSDTTLLGTIAAGISSLVTSITTALDFTSTPAETLNTEPFKLTGNLFTTRFPFSIPWDIQKCVLGFGSGSSIAPKWTISFPAPMSWTLVIDLSLFDSFIPAVRSCELVVFSVGLLMATRKVLGGDA